MRRSQSALDVIGGVLTSAISIREWPAPLREEAYYGLAGEIVRTIGPHSEADEAALLLQLLVAFGVNVGRHRYFLVEASRHHANEFCVIVGDSAKARKGTSLGWIASLYDRLDAPAPTKGGVTSGEGLIFAARDDLPDRRILLTESEFASPLAVMARVGNNLSPILRQAWDGTALSILTKNSPTAAAGAHIGFIGHITMPELLKQLSETDALNGFANRFLWCCARRSKCLPDGGSLSETDLTALADKIRLARESAHSCDGRVPWDSDAHALWRAIYPQLSAGAEGLFGSVTSRAEAHVVRLSLIYALLDRSAVIRIEHLRAALAVWEYCEESARYLFGNRSGDPIAEKILERLLQEPTGATRTEINRYFKGHRSRGEIDRALDWLESTGRAFKSQSDTGGRPAETWFAISANPSERSERNEQSTSGTDEGGHLPV